MDYVWYAGYGSNTLEERFLCYIRGGRFRLGGMRLSGCHDKTLPIDTDEFLIPYEMYFAGQSHGWNGGGTAFIDPRPSMKESKFTRARLWKVTAEQFLDIWNQEGKVNHDLRLGLGSYADGCQIETFTSGRKLDSTRPSNEYIQTIVLGLRETFAHDTQSIVGYLAEVEGIAGRITMGELHAIVTSANGSAPR